MLRGYTGKLGNILLHLFCIPATHATHACGQVLPAMCQKGLHGVCRCGQGKVSRGDGYQYSGHWLDDLPHGLGMLTRLKHLLQCEQLPAVLATLHLA